MPTLSQRFFNTFAIHIAYSIIKPERGIMRGIAYGRELFLFAGIQG